MKLLSLLMSLLITLSLHSQTDASKKAKQNANYRVWIKTVQPVRDISNSDILNTLAYRKKFRNNKISIPREKLIQLNETSVTFSPSFNFKIAKRQAYSIPISEIETLSFRKKGSKLKGFLIGASIGALTGILIGRSNSNNCARLSNCLSLETDDTFGFIFGVSAGIIGAAIGGDKKEIPINGNMNSYQLQKELLEQYIFTPKKTGSIQFR